LSMNKYIFYFALIILLPVLVFLVHQNPREGSIVHMPYDLMAVNTPGDSLGSITLNWLRIGGDDSKAASSGSYSILRSENSSGPFNKIDEISFQKPGPTERIRQYRDTTQSIGQTYYYKISSHIGDKTAESNIIGPIKAVSQTVQAGFAGVLTDVLFPPSQLRVFDSPNDEGRSIILEWRISPNDIPKSTKFGGYEVYRSTNPLGPFEMVGDATGGETDFGRHVKIFNDGNNVHDGTLYYYYVQAKWDGQTAKTDVVGPAKASAQWFHTGRTVSLLLLGILVAVILFYINQAKSGKDLFIRKIAGLEAVDEAVGRATEMGKKVFYIPGTSDMDNVQTIAGLTILSRVAKLTAEYETKLEVPVSKSLVMITGREVVREAYLNVGRGDFYNDDMVYYLTDDQFGYAAGIDGLVVRQRPATIFYMGAFYAEALVLAETGNSIGAIQIAGTAMPAQLPFFVAACDYTLIGEELFAASAYLSREPKLLGSLKGQDIGGKLVFLSLSLIFIAIVTITVFIKPQIAIEVSRIFQVN
jgi:hypothetical protein